MNLSYYGSLLDQAAIGGGLRTHEDDKNVSPEELAAFAQVQGFQAQVRINGNMDLLRTLLSNGLPVLIESWLIPEPNDGMGHYRLLTGYNDADQSWIAYDSYVDRPLLAPDGPYQGIRLDYAETDQLWTVFNRTYLLIYPAAHTEMVKAILGDEVDPQHMWQQALVQAQNTVQQQGQDPFAWFNLGTDLVAAGRYAEAAQAYDRAHQLGLPWRMLWYQYGPFHAYYATGRFADVVALADSTLATTNSIEELHYWRGWGLAGTGNLNAARQAWQQSLALNPNFTPASQALANAQ
jgi:tetratricopeptide (TPR) repeat protein